MIALHYESRFGLARGAVYRDGRPQLYLEGYETDPSLGLLGVRSVARLKSRSGGVHFLALVDGGEAVLDGPQEVLGKLTDGQAIEVEIIAEARRDKLARGKFIAVATGEPRRLAPASSLRERLIVQAMACFGEAPVAGPPDIEALDTARDGALNPSGALTGGGDLSVEVTRGLIACDVDTAGGEGSVRTPRAFAKACNERAAADLPRRLRLAGLGGLVVVDLIGSRHDGERLRQILLEGFGAEAQRIVVAPIGKFGTLEFTRPWGTCPLYDVTPMAQAVDLIWRAIGLSAQDRGRPVTLRATDAVIAILRPLLTASLDPLAPMLRLEVASRHEVLFV